MIERNKNKRAAVDNYEDHKCTWGFVTLCAGCAKKHGMPKVKGLPIMNVCEHCGVKAVKKGQ